MATTPKPTLKRRLAGTVEGRTPRFLLGSLGLAMVISVLAGIGIGMKVEQHRVKNSSTGPAVTSPKKPAAKSPAKIVRSTSRGTVTQITPKWLALSTHTGRKVIFFSPAPLIEITTAGLATDIAPGSRVLVTLRPKAAGPTATSAAARPREADQIIVVRGTGNFRLGRLVSAVTPTSITLKNPNGKLVTISTAGARILTTIKGAKTDLQTGRAVVVRTLLTQPKVKPKPGAPKPLPRAFEILVLPSPRPFG